MTMRRNSSIVEPLECRRLLAASIKIVGNGQRITPSDVTPSRADFTDYGPMALAGPIIAAGRTYTIKNSGDAPLRLTGARVSIQGTNANQFSVSKMPRATIDAGGGATFRIKFDPTSAGVKRATVVVTSVSQKTVYKFNIAGRALETTQVEGGTHVAVTTSGTGTAAAADYGVEMLYNGFFSYGDVFDTNFDTPNNPFPTALGVGSVIEGWDKGLIGTKPGEERVLFVPSNQAYGSTPREGIPANSPLIFETRTISVDKPSIKVTGNGTTIADGDTASSPADNTAFGSVARNSSIVKTFTVAAGDNNGNANPRFTSSGATILVNGTNASEFTASGVTSNGNGTVSFTVTFRPTATGNRVARIEIPNNNPDDSLYTFVISGVGT